MSKRMAKLHTNQPVNGVSSTSGLAASDLEPTNGVNGSAAQETVSDELGTSNHTISNNSAETSVASKPLSGNDPLTVTDPARTEVFNDFTTDAVTSKETAAQAVFKAQSEDVSKLPTEQPFLNGHVTAPKEEPVMNGHNLDDGLTNGTHTANGVDPVQIGV